MKTFSKQTMLKVAAAPAALSLALLSSQAFAQDPQGAEEAETGETIIVTGSLIRNPNLVQSTPVNVTTAETISLRQNNVAEEVLRDIPGVVPSIGSAVNNGNNGASYVDLRGLGSFRNIVLLDGNRIAPSGLVGRVDLNNIPLALVERVEALTGGASVTYGADAVSGVVNFVTRKDFSGVELSVGQKITERGDGNYFRSDLTVGANFDDNRGNATLSIGYQNSDPVYQGARDFSVNNISSFSGTFGGSGTSVPSRFSGTRPLTGGVPNTIAPFVQTGTTTDKNGNIIPVLAPVPGGLPNGGVRQVNAAGQAVGTFALYNFNPLNIFQTPFRRFNVFSTARYEVADGIEVYSRALFSKQHVDTIIAESGAFGGTVTIPLSNPYLPAAMRNQFCAFNVAPTVTGVDAAGNPVSGQASYTPRFTPAECAAAATATSPTNPAFRTVNVTLNRRAVEVGPRISDFQTTVFDYRAGVRGDITDAIQFDVSASYGESENTQTQKNYLLLSRIRSAVYATNTTSCLGGVTGGADIAASTGCVPLNIFGAAGTITPAMTPYLTAEATTSVRTSLAQVRALITGEAPVTSPFATDAVNFAFGGEYRKYTAAQASDTLSQTAGELGGAGGAAPNIYGAYEVYEGVGELNVPLVQDKPGFDMLSLEAGIRFSKYRISAPTSPQLNTTTWKVGGNWQPVAGFKLRGMYSHSVRAPNINELFSPVTTGLTNLAVDPCADAAPTTNANLRAICLAQGAPSGTIGSINQPTAGQANSTGGGNIALKPETSNSYTFGFVLTPTGTVPGLSLTVDYYNIKVSGAITQPTPGDAIAACFGNITAASATSSACTIIRRNPATGALDGAPDTTPGLFLSLSNQGVLKTDGIDVALNYKRDIGFAELGLSFTGNYTFHSKFQSSPSSLDRECVGYYSINCNPQPKFQWTQRTTLGFKMVDVSLQWRHIDKLQQEPDDIANGNGPGFIGNLPNGQAVNFQRIKAADYFDLAVRFDVTRNLEMVVTGTNILDRKPPIVGSTIGTTTYNSGNTYPSTYDALGRAYAVTAKLKF